MTAQTLQSRMLWRHDRGYEAARQGAVWNARKPDRFPDVIVMVESEADVVDAIEVARSRALKVAVRGGGHSWCGSLSVTAAC